MSNTKKATPRKPAIKAVPKPTEPPEEIKTPTNLLVNLMQVLNSLTEIPAGTTAGTMRGLGNGVEALLREAGVIKE